MSVDGHVGWGDSSRVDVFVLDHRTTMADASVALMLETLLSKDEKERCASISCRAVRLEKIATRALVRMALSRYAPCSPDQWTFAYGAGGRPEVSGTDFPGLHFNASNCIDMAVCAVSTTHAQIGADIEKLGAGKDYLPLARRFYAADEQAVMASAASPGEAEETFLRYWTLKESFLKARGEGLVHRLDHISFDLPARSKGAQHGIAMKLDDCIPGDPSQWRFHQWALDSRHMLSLAVNTGGTPVEARLWRVEGIRRGGGCMDMLVAELTGLISHITEHEFQESI